jgi:class 3 adenylate cyclase/tetratricopeptide (TPR) repeat protein
MNCPSCAAPNDDGRKFCGQCGSPLATACRACGAPNGPSDRFCGECGSPLDAAASSERQAAASPAPPERETERRLVSVLFADLVGFTTLSESRDAEDVRELLSRYFDTCRQIIGRYGGTVEKFIGDAVMAVWGAPVAQEDDAERAVRAALDLVDAVGAMGTEVGATDLRARAGVLTGEAAVNLAAQGQGMVAGDLVNTASRIQSAAEPGTVLVGDATRRATEAAIAYADAGSHALKGKAEPVQLWHATRVIAGVGGAMRSERLEPPFVGRERELRLVKELFHACTDEGRARLVQITGIAGIGKSRLSWEFYKYMDGLQRVFRWHRGRCLAYGEGVTYWALAEMVRGRAEIAEGEERSNAAPKLRAAVERYVVDAEERRFVEPRLAHLLGLEERVAPDKADLFAGWRLFFERMAEDAPVVMVFEDLQWADPSLVEFIEHLLEWSRNFPIFVVTLARPEADRPSIPSARTNATSLYLEPLARGDMARLLDGLVPGLPGELAGRILERAEGVPLYAVETVRMLLDRGALVQEGNVYRPADGPIDLDVPETLQALIAARLDGLTPAERAVVQDASVLGKTFTKGALATLAARPLAELDPLLAGLVAKEVLTVQMDPRSPERGQYGFLQDLVRTVAYETLAKRDRKQKHLQVARYLENAWGDDEEEIVEVVAAHYLDAYRLAPDAGDADEIRDRARAMLVRAAEKAASLAAAQEAASYFRRAADLTESSLESAELVERAGQMAQLRGRLDEAAAAYAEATELFERAGAGHAAARVQGRLAEVEFGRNHLEQALARMQRAYEVLAGDEPDRDLAIVAAQLGRFLALAQRHAEARPHLEEALELAEHLELPDVFAEALQSKALTLVYMSRLDEGATLHARALEVALDHGLTSTALRAFNNLGYVHEARDRFEDLLRLSDQALELARRAGDRGNELGVLLGSAYSRIASGQWDAALELASQADPEELETIEWVASARADLIPIYVHRGQLDEARDLLEELRSIESTDNVEIRSMYRLCTAEVLFASGDAARAYDEARAVVDIADDFGLTAQLVKRSIRLGVEAALAMNDLDRATDLLGIVERARPGQVTPYLRGHSARLSARLSAARGDHDSVEPGFVAAETIFRDGGMPFDLAVTLVEHAEWLVSQGRKTDAAPSLDEARLTFERLRATPWLERTGRLSAVVGETSVVAPA